jgi:hypothetical protein
MIDQIRRRNHSERSLSPVLGVNDDNPMDLVIKQVLRHFSQGGVRLGGNHLPVHVGFNRLFFPVLVFTQRP